MKKLLHSTAFRILAAISGLFFTSLFAIPFNDWLTAQNYYGAAPGKISAALVWIGTVAAMPVMQFMFVAIVSATAGACGHHLAVKRRTAKMVEVVESAVPGVSTDYQFQYTNIKAAKSTFWMGQRDVRGKYNLQNVNEDTRITLNALYAVLRRLGIKTPLTSGYAQPWQYNLMQLGYLERILKYCPSGLIPELNEEIDSYFETQRIVFAETETQSVIPKHLIPEYLQQ